MGKGTLPMIDFDNLVLGPVMNTFARPAEITPIKSQGSNVAAYTKRGVWTVKNVDVVMEDNNILSTKVLTLGVRLSEFPVPPVKGDVVYLPPVLTLPEEGPMVIDDTDEDGQGGSVWTLKYL